MGFWVELGPKKGAMLLLPLVVAACCHRSGCCRWRLLPPLLSYLPLLLAVAAAIRITTYKLRAAKQ